MASTSESVVMMRRVSKRFKNVTALDGIDFEVKPNEILGLVGENGAGKSTLMKILIGLYQPDEGEFILNGSPVSFKSPQMAVKSGIAMVFQEGCMIHNLSIMDNVFLCHEDGFRKNGLLDKSRMRKLCVDILARVKLDIDPDTMIRDLSPAERQMVEIGRLLWLLGYYGVKNPIMILDEPTTILRENEVSALFEILREIKSSASIILISHRLEEVIENSDRIVVFKDGKYVAELESKTADIHKIEELMVGRGMVGNHYCENEQREPAKNERLRLDGVMVNGMAAPVSFSLREGEIISLVGLIGSGKEELCKGVLGIIPVNQGKIFVEGREASIGSPGDAIHYGIGHVPIDRRNEGLALDFSVKDNINMLILGKLKTAGFINIVRERLNANSWVKECRIKTPSIYAKTSNLSGGNQQKVVISKWLSSGVKILILDHPTRGIDVGAKEEIYKRIRSLAESGMSLIVMCDTLEEDIGLCNRMLIMKDGKLVRELDCPKENKPTPQDIIGSIV